MAGNGNGNGGAGYNGRYLASEVVDAIISAKGLITKAADLLGCSPRTIYNYRDQYVSVKDAIEEARDRQLDHTESKLFDAIDKGDAWAIQMYLRTVGKGRGYTMREEVTGADGAPLVPDRPATPLDIQGMTDEELEAAIRAALSATAKGNAGGTVVEENAGGGGEVE